MIHIEQLEFRFPEGEFRLEVPELEVGRGDSLAMIGPSGCGKTTLLRLIAGILTTTVGRITTDDVELTRLSDAQRRQFRQRVIGLVFQEFELLEYLTVLDNILLPLRIGHSLTLDSEARRRAKLLAERVGLAKKLGRFPAHLSQGERQRVAVCRALVTGPKLLLADEPTGNLDPPNKARVLDHLIEFATEEKATLVVVTHDHGLLDRFDRVIDFQSFHGSEQASESMAATES